MKTKAYKLAAELGVGEESLLAWLRGHGYPNARRADTIRSEVAQAARKALGGRRDSRRSSRRSSQRHSRPPREQRNTGKLTASFAELLEGHLPQGVGDATSLAPDVRQTASMETVQPRVDKPADDKGFVARLARAEQERDAAKQQAAEARTRVVGLETQLGALRRELEALRTKANELPAIERIQQENDRLHLERVTLRQDLQGAKDERSTLEDTCTELQGQLREAQAALTVKNEAETAQASIKDDLESTIRRESAWRARALELERATQSGGHLLTALTDAGVSDLRAQTETLTAFLAQPDTAKALLRVIRQVDNGALRRLLQDRLRRVCAAPACRSVVAGEGRIALTAQQESDCEICAGNLDQRWFARMAQECGRGGVRRLLVVGGDAVHERLRALSQGRPVDLRLVPTEKAVADPRIKGRIESCDVLVLWSAAIVDLETSALYRQVALAAGRTTVSVLGARCEVSAMARAVSNRVARNHLLLAN